PHHEVAKELQPVWPRGKDCPFAFRACQRPPVEFSLRQLNTWKRWPRGASHIRPSCLSLLSNLLRALTASPAPPPAPLPGLDNAGAIDEVVADKGVPTAKGPKTTVPREQGQIRPSADRTICRGSPARRRASRCRGCASAGRCPVPTRGTPRTTKNNT